MRSKKFIKKEKSRGEIAEEEEEKDISKLTTS